jgi:predicted DNA-binding antitoxin AbrB/MazE fold protein
MAITVEAVYENGVLTPAEPLPLQEREKVRLTIEPGISGARRLAGILKWTGSVADLDRLIEGDDDGDHLDDSAGRPRPYGLCAGQFTVPDDFDQPLPENILREFEGR